MIATRVNRIKPSFTLEMTAIAADLRSKGVEVFDLGVGQPDFNTPPHICDAAKKAMDDGFTKYTPGSGMLELREAVCNKLMRDNGLNFSPDEVIVSNGAKHSLSTACQALFNPGDKVIIFAPYWVSFPEFIRLADADPVIVRTRPDKRFEPDFEDLESKITPDIKGVIINSPSNPTGGVWSDEAVKNVLGYAEKYGWIVISDECYEQLVYDKPFTSIAKIGDGSVSILTIQSLSKTYAMTGWRIGYAAGDRQIIKAMSKIQGQATSCPNSIGQKAAVTALNDDQESVIEMVKLFKSRRNSMINRLNEIPHVSCDMPGGAFYAFPDISYYLGKVANGNKIETSFDLSDYILDCARVVTVAGAGFGQEGHIRLSYATDEKLFLTALDKIAEVLQNLK